MRFYARSDADGTVARAAATFLNSANDPAIVSASAVSRSGSGNDRSSSSKPAHAPPVWVIALVVSAIVVSLIILLVLVVILAVRRGRMQAPKLTKARGVAGGEDAVMEGLYANSGSNRVNNPLLSNYSNYDNNYA